MSIQDGSVVWQKDFLMGLRKLPLVIGYNKKETFTSSGTFTPTMTGLYKITLQGGGGGGGGAGTADGLSLSGGGGGQGGHGEFYETLTAGTSYSYTIGAGGAGGTAGSSSTAAGNGSDGGASTITINDKIYTSNGGHYGTARISSIGTSRGGVAGSFKIGDSTVSYGSSGTAGRALVNNKYYVAGGTGGGPGGISFASNSSGHNGGGGAGGGIASTAGVYPGAPGGDGYITFEWFDPADAFPSIWAELEPST